MKYTVTQTSDDGSVFETSFESEDDEQNLKFFRGIEELFSDCGGYADWQEKNW